MITTTTFKGDAVKLFDDVLHWEGYGGKFNLAAGRCRLRLFDLSKDKGGNGGAPQTHRRRGK